MDGGSTATATAAEEPASQEEEQPARSRRRAAKKNGAPAAPTLCRVTFEDNDEFMEQLLDDASRIEGDVVRITARELPSGPNYIERRTEVICGYIVGGQVMELVWSTPPYWAGPMEQPEDAAKAIAEQIDLVRSTCAAGSLDVRGGRFGSL